jgi:hypothetical protein
MYPKWQSKIKVFSIPNNIVIKILSKNNNLIMKNLLLSSEYVDCVNHNKLKKVLNIWLKRCN